jgi:hypothetical protein
MAAWAIRSSLYGISKENQSAHSLYLLTTGLANTGYHRPRFAGRAACGKSVPTEEWDEAEQKD